jgi:hypothetical protein
MAVSESVRERANALLFNGSFYTHFHKLSDVSIEGVDEASQLSLSNPMAINRGLATHEMAVSILNEYQERKTRTGAFAEWFSIDPPFPDGVFGDEKLVGGAYCNGGIMPLVGGELARAAFAHGMEAYGASILEQYRAMIAEKGETYLWYFPDGTPSSIENSTSPDAMPTDGWGSSAMLYAFVEGLCGIEDQDAACSKVRCSPRWAATTDTEADIEIRYAATGAGFGYQYLHDPEKQTIRMYMKAAGTEVTLNVLLPEGCRATEVFWEGRERTFSQSTLEDSVYVEAQGTVTGRVEIDIHYARY